MQAITIVCTCAMKVLGLMRFWLSMNTKWWLKSIDTMHDALEHNQEVTWRHLSLPGALLGTWGTVGHLGGNRPKLRGLS